MTAAKIDRLEHGRDSYRRRAWRDAYDSLSRADQVGPLAVEDLERLATSAYLIGRERDYRAVLDRAHRAHVQAGDPERAARCAFWPGLTLLLGGDAAHASGWLARARRLVEGRDCAEHGYLLVLPAEQHLGERESDAAHAVAARAVEIGDRFGDPDLVAIARHLQGRALIQRGEVPAGLALLDETMLAAVGGHLLPIVTGLVYCSVIEVCQDVFALSRAREWTSALARWCDQQPEMLAFTSTCLVRRAEIMLFLGAWPDAMREARRACEHDPRGEGPRPPAAALYQRAELHRLKGEFAAAESAYRDASRLGCEPQPGLALLRLAQGRTDAACAGLRRVLGAATDPLRRARLLPAYVDVMLATGDVEEARSACNELEHAANTVGTDVLRAMAAHARGAVNMADGRSQAALISLQRAFELWRQVEAPYEAARVRVRIGVVCRALGDAEGSTLAFDAAKAEFERLGAAPDLTHLAAIEERKRPVRPHGLTPRELQVLRLLASGRTNKAIAAELVLSQRTIDRHVSNILTKLNVPSRAAATAFAYDHKLI